MTSNNTDVSPLTMLQKLDGYFEGKQQLIFWGSLIVAFMFSLLLFEPKVSIGGDDSIYINRAYNFINKGSFPSFQGPLYPMTIGGIISLVGVNLVVLKLFSLLCLLIHQWFTFKLFKNYLSPFALFTAMVLISSSSAILYFGSATYNEAFYLCIQSIFLFHFERSFLRNPIAALQLKRDIKKFLVSGFLLFLLSITKNIGIVVLIAVIIYYLISKNWKGALMIAGTTAIFILSFNVIKSTAWDIKETQVSNQGNTLLLKNPYRPELGKEDAYGFWTRLVQNSKSYLGYHFINFFGVSKKDNFKGNSFVAFLIYGLLITGFIIYFKKSRFWLFIGVFVGVSFGATFLALQTYWNQERLIIAFTPVLLIFLLNVLYDIFTVKTKKYQSVFLVIASILLFANLIKTFSKIPEQTKVISKYLEGDSYYGFSEDWVNYLKMTKWAKENLPEETYVACRKPGMAFIYSGGKDFYGIWKVTSDDPKVLYDKLKDAGVTHVIMANIRMNAKDPNSRIINTVRRYLGFINKAYPGKITLVHKNNGNWPAFLYKLD